MFKRHLLAVLLLAGGTFVMCGNLSAGARGGSQLTETSVNAFGTDRFNGIYFWAGDLARVHVSGDGDTDLDLYVYDHNGNLVGKDDDLTDECIVTWVPRRSGYFYIVVKNRGAVYNAYTLRTN